MITSIKDKSEETVLGQIAKNLESRIMHALRGKPVCGTTVDVAKEIIKQHRRDALYQRGVRFPEMVVVPLIEHQRLKLYRQDLDDAAVQQIILNLNTEFPGIYPKEIAFGLQQGWPGRIFSNYGLVSKPRITFESVGGQSS